MEKTIMTVNFKFKILFMLALPMSIACVANENSKISEDLAPETLSGQVKNGFWKNPNVNYVATEWPIDDSDLKFWDVPELEKAFVDTAPTDRNDGLIVGELGVDGGDKDMLVKLAEEIADGQHDKIDSLLITHKGKLVFESYYSWGRINLTHPQASATKTYTGLALGRAIQLGYLSMSDLEKPITSFLKDLDPSKFIEGADRITLRQALTMTTGIRINDENKEKMQKNPHTLKGQREVQAIFEYSDPITAESEKFAYSSGPELVMQVIEAVVPGTAKDFIKNEFFGKMGITTYRWLPGESGLPAGGWKLSITSRAMAKIGTLAMNLGKWNGEQLVPAAFMTQAISRINYSAEDVEVYGGGKDVSNQGYGYLWWSGDLKVGDKSYFSASAQGGGGNYIILIQELELMVVVTGHERHPSTLQITAERILPAFVENFDSTMNGKKANQNKLPRFEGPYLGQKPPGLTAEVFAPDIVTTEYYEFNGVFTPDMKEFYLIRQGGKYEKPTLVVFRQKNNQWYESVISPRVGTPFISPDGKTMYLGRSYKERIGTDWSEKKSLGSSFKDMPIMRLTASAKGTYFFDEFKSDFTGDIRYSRSVNGQYQEPKRLSKKINTGKSFHPFIAPDESYLIFDGKRAGGYGDSDLYISYRQPDGSWGEAINLGDKINTEAWEAVASVTPDGKYLFFNRNMGTDKYENVDIFWVDAQIIETLKQN